MKVGCLSNEIVTNLVFDSEPMKEIKNDVFKKTYRNRTAWIFEWVHEYFVFAFLSFQFSQGADKLHFYNLAIFQQSSEWRMAFWGLQSIFENSKISKLKSSMERQSFFHFVRTKMHLRQFWNFLYKYLKKSSIENLIPSIDCADIKPRFEIKFVTNFIIFR